MSLRGRSPKQSQLTMNNEIAALPASQVARNDNLILGD